MDGSDVFGGVTIFSGAITYLLPSDLTIPLPEKPAPNTVITLPGSAGTITLNYQNTTAGVHTFEAIKAVLAARPWTSACRSASTAWADRRGAA